MSQTNISGVTDAAQGGRPGDESDGHQRGYGKEKKIGHRRVTNEGTVTYKKKSTSELQRAIQLGIEHSVSQNLPQRDLLLRDFGVVETVEFPALGSRITPAHSLSEFKFKTYAPYAFRFFRALFDVNLTEFLLSLCVKDLRELSNPGASGSIFYITQDDEFIIKTVQHKEAAFLQKLLPEYYMNLTQNKYTLLPKYYGLYCYQCGGKNIRFVVMNNLLPSSIPIHEKYDLKGSTYKRSANSRERSKSSPTLKDLDFRELNPEGIMIDEFEALKLTIERDCRVLESFRIMDYSLLLGVHNLDKAKADATAGETSNPSVLHKGGSSDGMSLTNPSEGASGGPVPTRGRSIKRIAAHTTAMEALQGASAGIVSSEGAVGSMTAADDIPEDMPALVSSTCPGGVPARNSKGERLLLFIGIIDILQNYRLLKKMEHTMKSIVHDADSISVHNPAFYAQRFQSFLLDHVFHKMPSQEPSRFRKVVQAASALFAIKHAPSRKKGNRSRANTRETEHGESEDRPPDPARKVSLPSSISDASDCVQQVSGHQARPRRTSAAASFAAGTATARDSLIEEKEPVEEEEAKSKLRQKSTSELDSGANHSNSVDEMTHL